MRKLICLFLCLIVLSVPVFAFDGITSAQSQTIVGTDGACQVSITVTLQLTSSVPAFPLPENATDISVSIPHARITRSGGHRNVDLSSLGAGTHTLTIHYSLPNAVAPDEKGNLTLTVPLTSGFALPIEQMDFSIELPGTPEHRPTFISTYSPGDPESVMSSLQWKDSNVISGTVSQRLPDHESLTMTLAVSRDMFPDVPTGWAMDTVDALMAAIFSLALILWLITMRCLPPRRSRRALPTPGLNAGEIPCRLAGQGMDLTLAVLSWAQMGYILIQSDDNGRVLLHKRMDMGNERSELENRLFRNLFGKRDLADASSYRYAQLCRKASAYRAGAALTYKRGSGNPQTVRFLAVIIGTLGGVSMGIAFADDTAWKVVLSIFLGILGTVAGWQIQSAVKGLFHRYKLPLLIGLGCSLVWFLLSLLAGEWHTGLFVILSQWLAGLATAFGGRRTESGQQNMSEILGLRKFMRTATAEELQRILDANPHYFYDLAPYALALDADRAFARRFGNVQLPECPYLTTGMDGHMTVKEWDLLLRDTADAMDALQRRLPLDRLLGR